MSAFKMATFTETPDLNDWFFVAFMEEWCMHSGEKDKEALVQHNAISRETHKLIDWCISSMDMECDYKLSKKFCEAILNTIDLEDIMTRINDWSDENTCADCKRCMVDCECEDTEDEEDKNDAIKAQGLPMSKAHLKDWLGANHPSDSKACLDHSHSQENGLTI